MLFYCKIHSQGGPRPHSTTAYGVENVTVAEVTSGGLITAKVVGKTVVQGKARGYDAQTGNEIIYSTVRISYHKVYYKFYFDFIV